MKGDIVSDDMKTVALVNVLFEEFWLYVRRQGLHNDRHSF